MTTRTDENDIPLCACGHAANLHARVEKNGVTDYPCRQVLPLDLNANPGVSEPPPCPCVDYTDPWLGG